MINKFRNECTSIDCAADLTSLIDSKRLKCMISRFHPSGELQSVSYILTSKYRNANQIECILSIQMLLQTQRERRNCLYLLQLIDRIALQDSNLMLL